MTDTSSGGYGSTTGLANKTGNQPAAGPGGVRGGSPPGMNNQGGGTTGTVVPGSTPSTQNVHKWQWTGKDGKTYTMTGTADQAMQAMEAQGLTPGVGNAMPTDMGQVSTSQTTGGPPPPANPQPTTTDQFNSQWGIIAQAFQAMGITDPSALSWAQGLITNGASAAEVEVEMYDQPWFQARFPAIKLRQDAHLPPLSVADYLAYENTVSQLSQQVGLPQGFVDKDEITQLLVHNVSTSELTSRMVDGLAAANTAAPEIRQTLAQYYNVGPGGLAAFWLNPDKAISLLQKEFQAAQIGGEAAITGWGSLQRASAEQLAALGISQDQATQGFQQLAHMGQAYNPLPGEAPGSTGVTRDQQVAGQFEGNAADQLAMQLAAQRRQAQFQGTTQFAGGTQGATGVGQAVPNR